jgi:tetratricopeptide (TPR) repeat protein
LQIEASTRFELTKEVQGSLRNRMSDTSWNINFWGVLITILGLIVAVGAVVGGFVSSRRTIEAAGEKMELWLKEHHVVLEEEARVRINKTVEESLLPAKSIEKQLGDLIGKAKLQVDDFTQQAKQGLSDLSERMADVSKVPASNDIEQLHQSVKSLKVKFDSIPESLSADELFNLGLEAYFSKEYVSAIDYWERVVGHIEKSELMHVNALFNQGITYGVLKQLDKSINNYQQLIDQYAGSENTEIQYQVVRAILQKGVVFRQLEQFDHAIICYQEIIDNYGESKLEEVQVQVVVAMLNKALALDDLKQSDQAMFCYQNIVDIYGKSEVEEIQVQVAKAIMSQGISYGRLDDPFQAIKYYQKVVDIYAESKSEKLQFEVTNAIYFQGNSYKNLKEFEMAINCYQKLIIRNDDSEDENIKIGMAVVLNDIGFVYGQMKKPEKAIEYYQKIIDLYNNDEFPNFKDSVEVALLNIAESFVMIKPKNEALSRIRQAQAVTQEGEVRYSIASFLLFMLEGINFHECLGSIKKINDSVNFTWNFDEIREYVEKQSCSKKRTQLKVMIDFFENHHCIETLERDLNDI